MNSETIPTASDIESRALLYELPPICQTCHEELTRYVYCGGGAATASRRRRSRGCGTICGWCCALLSDEDQGFTVRVDDFHEEVRAFYGVVAWTDVVAVDVLPGPHPLHVLLSNRRRPVGGHVRGLLGET